MRGGRIFDGPIRGGRIRGGRIRGQPNRGQPIKYDPNRGKKSKNGSSISYRNYDEDSDHDSSYWTTHSYGDLGYR